MMKAIGGSQFAIGSAACAAISLLAYALGVFAFVAAWAPDGDKFVPLVPGSLLIGFWAAPVGSVLGIAGLIVHRRRTWPRVVPVILNGLIVAVSLGALAIGTTLMKGH